MSDNTVLDRTFYLCLRSLTGVVVHSNEGEMLIQEDRAYCLCQVSLESRNWELISLIIYKIGFIGMATVYSPADPTMTRCGRKPKNLEVHQSYKAGGLSWSSVYSGIPTKQIPMPVIEWV